jgi:hypothetical protein
MRPPKAHPAAPDPEDRMILVTDGIINRRTRHGAFGVDGIRAT